MDEKIDNTITNCSTLQTLDLTTTTRRRPLIMRCPEPWLQYRINSEKDADTSYQDYSSSCGSNDASPEVLDVCEADGTVARLELELRKIEMTYSAANEDSIKKDIKDVVPAKIVSSVASINETHTTTTTNNKIKQEELIQENAPSHHDEILSSLKNEISQLESHFKWMKEIESTIDSARIATLKEKMLSWVEESTDVHTSLFQEVTQYLSLACYDALLGNFQEASRRMQQAEAKVAKNTAELNEELSEENLKELEYVRVFTFVLLCDRVNILALMAKSEKDIENLKNEKNKVSMYLSELDISGKACQASLLALKAQMANQLGKTSYVVENYRKAVALDPKNYDWQHHLYTSLRRLRREIDFASSPTEEERIACFDAFDLRPNSCWSYLTNATLWEDVNKAEKNTLSKEEYTQNAKQIIEQYTLAQEVNPNSISTNVRLAEAYSSPGPYCDIEKSRDLFQECERRWPNNSQVLHKIGKFYLNGINDRGTAEKYCQKALEADAQNFPCFMEYFRLLERRQTINQLIVLIDKFIPEFMPKAIYYSKLLILKGLLQWNKDERSSAVKTWSKVFGIKQDSVALLKEIFKNIRTYTSFSKKALNTEALKSEVCQLINSSTEQELLTNLEEFLKLLEQQSENRSKIRSYNNSDQRGLQGDFKKPGIWRKNENNNLDFKPTIARSQNENVDDGVPKYRPPRNTTTENTESFNAFQKTYVPREKRLQEAKIGRCDQNVTRGVDRNDLQQPFLDRTQEDNSRSRNNCFRSVQENGKPNNNFYSKTPVETDGRWQHDRYDPNQPTTTTTWRRNDQCKNSRNIEVGNGAANDDDDWRRK